METWRGPESGPEKDEANTEITIKLHDSVELVTYLDEPTLQLRKNWSLRSEGGLIVLM